MNYTRNSGKEQQPTVHVEQIVSRQITKEQKQILESVAIVLAGINENLENMQDNDIIEMLAACDSTSQTNCWCWTYQAAKYLKPCLIEQIQLRKIELG
jgi:hypothetical protein